MTDLEIAKKAVEQAGQAGATALELAKSFVADGFDTLQGMTGYDPRLYGSVAAIQAVLAYATSRLMKESPLINASFVQNMRVWAKRAAKEYHLEQNA
jgi:hypothetical protein